MESLARYVKDRRIALGMTQIELADAAGISQPVLSDIERSRTKLPSAEARRGLARALHVQPIDLLVAAGELSVEEVPGPTRPARNLADPAGRLCDLLHTLDLTVDRREATLTALLEMFREQDRARRLSDAPASPATGS